MRNSPIVRAAKKATSSSLLESLSEDFNDGRYRISLLKANELEENDSTGIWLIFKDNMHDVYARSSFGWNPVSKKEELFNPSSRFLLAYSREGEQGRLLAFCMFRFEYEDRRNIIYCYDLHVSKNIQRSGLGKKFVELLTKIGIDRHMDKIQLTVFKNNHDALKFYEATGFDIDESSPSNYLEEGSTTSVCDVDYEILSKAL